MRSGDGSLARDDWLQQAGGLRRLAASLLRDEFEADDLVQETWLKAWRADAPERSTAAHAPGLLRSILRNLVRDRLRERARRAGTERAAARDERLPSDAEVVERLEIAQRLAAEVARLPEPYRSTIHLRYFEERSPEELARLARVPLETVNTRLRRGLEKLRERMDHGTRGGRASWMLALAPLAARLPRDAAAPAGPILATTGVLMSTKVVLSSVVAAVAVAGLFLLWQRDTLPGSHSAANASTLATNGPELESELRAKLAAALGPTREAAATPAAEAPSAPPAAVVVNGRVVIEDEHGREHADESGTLTLAHFRTQADARFVELHVEAGAWSAEFPANETLVAVRLVARDREAALPSPSPLVLEPGPVVVRGKWLERGWIRVIDAVTKQELSGLEIRAADGWRANPSWTHPGDDPRAEIVLSNATSPVELPERKYLTPYWIHAPGHAWARVDFDHRRGGERTIELLPEPAAVDVTLVPANVPDGARVRLYPTLGADGAIESGEAGMRWAAPEHWEDWQALSGGATPREGRARIEDLQPGRYVAAVETGTYEETLRLGEAPIEVRAGETAFVTVTVDAALANVPRTHLVLTIVLPEALEAGDCTLILRRIGGGEREIAQPLSHLSYPQGRDRERTWDGLVRTGDYLVELQGVQLRARIHAPGPGETRATIEIPPLVDVAVEVVDALSGASVAPERLQWTGAEVEGAPGRSLMPIARDPKSGAFHFRAPRGEAEVFCVAAGYEEAQTKLALAGETARCRFELKRATGIHVRMLENGASLPVGFDYLSSLRVTRVDGAPSETGGSTSTDSEVTRLVTGPGRYRVEFPPLAGFRAIGAREVDVRSGEVVELDVAVERER